MHYCTQPVPAEGIHTWEYLEQRKYQLYNVRLSSALVQYQAGRVQTLKWNAIVISKVHTRNCKWPMHRFASYNTPYWAHSHNCGKLLLTSSCLSVCLFVRVEQVGSHRTVFHEIWHWIIFRKSSEKIQVSLKPRTLHWRPVYIYNNILPNSSWNEKYFRQSCKDNQNTQFTINNFFYHAVSEIM